MTPVQTVAGNACYLASVIVPRTSSTRDITVLETAMQGLAQDARHPVALELAATASSRHFLLRATSAMSQRHLADQVQARYPQAIIRPLTQEDDPLALREGETVSAVELRAGAAAYLPLRAFRERELLQEGADPLLGILGVFNHLPAHMRVVTQLALIPASPTWSRAYRRKSVEHPLEQERLRARREFSNAQANGPGTLQLVGMGVLVALLLVWWRFQTATRCAHPILAATSRPVAAAWKDATTHLRPSGHAGNRRGRGARGPLLPGVRRLADQEPSGYVSHVRYAPGG